jgi:Spy/CpxP family protein refolding chaperone
MRTLLLALGGLVALSSVAVAFEPGAHRGHHPEPSVLAQKMADNLGLDEATQETIEAILEGARAEGEPLGERIKALYAELEAERAEDTPNDKLVRKLVKEIASVRADVALLKMATADEIEALLTPEQAERFRAFRQMRRAGYHRHERSSSPPPEFFDDL